ncbi:Speckle targeted PIP5K1A-regulated poly(A)polymerase [Striga asiatica]|uniref:Speckle targeted PIP5K1A-regulated poly(A)polymerase n=1 Tax=Striga asiatica TaxID=4170 RepID=A0A5A7PC37_STRAF|nr:Speckle targeted PIP5K1A-regulated poly(A)polymerase [Striga asiatica]
MDYKDRLINQQVSAMEQDEGQMHLPLSTSLSRYSVPSSNYHDLQMAVLIEMEKEKIREEIIISEIAKRRVLQAEVSRELMRWVPAIGSHVLFTESLRLLHLEERVIFMDEAKKERHEGLGIETPLFHGRTGGLRIPEVKPVCREGSEGNKIILLGKPDGNVSELKGKEVTSDCSNVRFQTLPFVSYADLGVSSEIKHEKQNVKGKVDEKKSGVKRKSVSQVSSGKKPKEYWNCSICHINCTGKRPLDNHIQGRKHKVKEAALRDKKAGKNFCIGFPRKVKLWMKV